MAALNDIDIQGIIVSTTPHPTIPGIEKIAYRNIAHTPGGQPIPGTYIQTPKYKTVYDPAIIKDDDFIKYGMEAANNAESVATSSGGTLGSIWNGVASNSWNYDGFYRDGVITSFFVHM
jgi:hypothetical protein